MKEHAYFLNLVLFSFSGSKIFFCSRSRGQKYFFVLVLFLFAYINEIFVRVLISFSNKLRVFPSLIYTVK